MKNPKNVPTPKNNLNTTYSLKAVIEKGDGTIQEMRFTDKNGNGLILGLILILIWLLSRLMKTHKATPSVHNTTNSSRAISYTYNYIPKS